MIANTSDSAARKIPTPVSVDETLLFWLLHAHKGRLRHDFAARQYEKYRFRLGMAATVCATLAGASMLGELAEQTSVGWIKWATGGVGILAGFLTGLNTFLKHSEHVEKHRSTGVRYKAAIREFERRIGLGSSAIAPADVENLKKQLDDLEAGAPVVSERIYDDVEKEWNKHGIQYVPRAADLYPPE
jgi:hypothetical protein